MVLRLLKLPTKIIKENVDILQTFSGTPKK